MDNNNHLIAPRLGVAWDPTGNGKWAIRAGVGQFFNRDRLWPLQIAGGNPPFNPGFNSLNGNGRFLDNTNSTAGLRLRIASAGLGLPSIGQSTSDQMPNAWQWNLSVQHEVFKNAKLEVAYVGNKNNHWEQIADVNFVPSGRSVGVRAARKYRTGDVLSAFRPYGALVGNNSITYYSHGSSSNYQSLQAFFNARVRNNTTFQASYTWSKLLADSQRLDTPAPNVDGEDRHAALRPGHPEPSAYLLGQPGVRTPDACRVLTGSYGASWVDGKPARSFPRPVGRRSHRWSRFRDLAIRPA